MDMVNFYHNEGDKMTSGERLKYLRQANNLTQKDIAIKLGVEPAAISKYELDLREPNIDGLIKLADTFNVTVDYLVGRTPDEFMIKGTNKSDLSKYNALLPNLKGTINNLDAFLDIANEMCSGVGDTSYGKSYTKAEIYLDPLNDIITGTKSNKVPTPQLLLMVEKPRNFVIIVEVDPYENDFPLTASERIEIYAADFSKEHDVFGIAVKINERDYCRVQSCIYQKLGSDVYTSIHLPRKLLTVHEYLDVLAKM